MNLKELIAAAQRTEDGKNLPPVENWHPENCANMDMKILRDGSWHHEGRPISRHSLIRLFSTILRKDETGETWLVTPIEKVQVNVALAHFIAIAARRVGEGDAACIYFTTNVDDVVRLDANHPLQVNTDTQSLAPTPLLTVRGRLQALVGRSVFYQLVEWAIERDGVLGVVSENTFFALGPKGIHQID